MAIDVANPGASTASLRSAVQNLLMPVTIDYTGDPAGLSFTVLPQMTVVDGVATIACAMHLEIDTAPTIALTMLSIGGIYSMDGGFDFVAPSLTSLDLSSVRRCRDIGVVANAMTSFNLSNLVDSSVVLDFQANSLPSLDLSSLTTCHDIGFTADAMTLLDLSSLSRATGHLSFQTPSLASLDLSSLTTCTDLSFIAGAITSLDLPALTTVTGSVSFTANALTNLDLSALTSCVGHISFTANALSSVNLSSLTSCGGFVSFTSSATTSVDLSGLVSCYGVTLSATPNLTTFTLGSSLKSMAWDCSITGAKLTQASVDNFLTALAALDGTNGTTVYSGSAVDLSGGTNATPSATGLAAKATLEGRGCTVTVN